MVCNCLLVFVEVWWSVVVVGGVCSWFGGNYKVWLETVVALV